MISNYNNYNCIESKIHEIEYLFKNQAHGLTTGHGIVHFRVMKYKSNNKTANIHLKI